MGSVLKKKKTIAEDKTPVKISMDRVARAQMVSIHSYNEINRLVKVQ
jgi:hypothetical protein